MTTERDFKKCLKNKKQLGKFVYLSFAYSLQTLEQITRVILGDCYEYNLLFHNCEDLVNQLFMALTIPENSALEKQVVKRIFNKPQKRDNQKWSVNCWSKNQKSSKNN